MAFNRENDPASNLQKCVSARPDPVGTLSDPRRLPAEINAKVSEAVSPKSGIGELDRRRKDECAANLERQPTAQKQRIVADRVAT